MFLVDEYSLRVGESHVEKKKESDNFVRFVLQYYFYV